MQFFKLAQERNQTPRTMDYLLRSTFAGIALLLLTVSLLGIWSTNRLQQPLVSITQQNLPKLQAIDAVRVALLTQMSDDRQILFETNAANFDADLDLMSADESIVRDSFTHLTSLYPESRERTSVNDINHAFTVWFAFQDRFNADLAQRTVTGTADALSLQEGTGAFRQQGWVVAELLTQWQNLVQSEAHADEQTAATAVEHLFWILALATIIALGLIFGSGSKVTNLISKMHQHQLLINTQLSGSLSEIRLQHEEIRMQRESLLATNADLERSVAARLVAEEVLATTLEESQRTGSLYATISETVNDGLAVFNPDGSLAYSNAAYQRILNLPPATPYSIADAAKPFKLLTLDGVIVPVDQHPVVRVLAGEAPDPPTTYLLALADGERRVVLKESVPLIGSGGTHYGALSVVRDITTEYHDARNSEILRELAHACASAPDEAALATSAVQVISERLELPFCLFIVRDREREGFARVLTSHIGPNMPNAALETLWEQLAATPIAADAPFVPLQVLATGKALYNVMPVPKPIYKEHAEYLPLLQSASYLPIQIEQTTVGVLVISHGAQQMAIWDAAEQELLQSVTDELTLAWHRAQLYEDARRLALFDPLTGLHNHRALQQILLDEIQVSESDHVPVTAIMLDIDHFRRFNENYGHDIGDEALRTVSLAIKNSLRPDDYAARYGGEEFTIILPGIAADQAARVGERIRSAIADNPVTVPGVAHGVPITASLGFATLPIDAVTPETLLKCADVALYAAKHRGRNRVVAYEDSLTTFPTLLAS